jgi:hypothetical protein
MMVKVTIEAVIDLPEGTIVPEDGRAFTLPSGDWVKPWVVLEMNDDRDLGQNEMEDWGLSIDEGDIIIEAAGWAS